MVSTNCDPSSLPPANGESPDGAESPPHTDTTSPTPPLAFWSFPKYKAPMNTDASPPAGAFFPDFDAFQQHLDARGMFRINPGLERISGVLARLGLTRPPFVVVQVAGTNGKGSTSAMLEALARAHGLSTGLYTSPHLVSVCERIRLNGVMASEADLLRNLEPIMAVGGSELTYFELLTALAVLVFAEAHVDLAVLETGLGGTWDAVTAVAADATLFTPIDLDHAHILGPTLAHIAKDKAGAMHPGVPALCAPQQPEAMRELEQAAQAKGVALRVTADEPWPQGFTPDDLGLLGPHQHDNARLALAAWHLLCGRAGSDADSGKAPASGADITPTPPRPKSKLTENFPNSDLEVEALRSVRIPGRLQRTISCPAARLLFLMVRITPMAWPPWAAPWRFWAWRRPPSYLPAWPTRMWRASWLTCVLRPWAGRFSCPSWPTMTEPYRPKNWPRASESMPRPWLRCRKPCAAPPKSWPSVCPRRSKIPQPATPYSFAARSIFWEKCSRSGPSCLLSPTTNSNAHFP